MMNSMRITTGLPMLSAALSTIAFITFFLIPRIDRLSSTGLLPFDKLIHGGDHVLLAFDVEELIRIHDEL